jgi:hypothetical protein
VCTHDKENHRRCDKGTAQKGYVTHGKLVGEGVISAFHFSETRVFDLFSLFKNFFCILMEVNKTIYGNNEDVPKIFCTICIQNHTYMMSQLQLCGMSLWQMKTRVSINHQ